MNHDTRDRLSFALTAANTADENAPYPGSDAADQFWGARFIPGEVTMARRAGQGVRFIHDCRCPSCWYWVFLDQNGEVPGERKRGRRPKKIEIDSHYYGANDYRYSYGPSVRFNQRRLLYKAGQRIMHYDPSSSEYLKKECGGKCECGNTHIRGGCVSETGIAIERLEQ